MSFVAGETVGAYRIIEPLGQGGMASVFKAYHASLDRYVAIKVLHMAFNEDRSFLSRFTREARVVARLEHPNIVPIYDFAEHEGRPYLVLKYIEGETLKASLERGPLDTAEILAVLDAVGSALAYAHRQGVLHRDVKPSNVLMAKDGQIYLADFGLARIAQSGESSLTADRLVGTPQYISPEQAMSKADLDGRTDIYSFGVLLYELLAGRVPFNADTPFAVIHDHIYSPLPLPRQVNPNLPEVVERVLLKALAKERDDRFSDVSSMVVAMRAALTQGTLPDSIQGSLPPTLITGPVVNGQSTTLPPAGIPSISSAPTAAMPGYPPSGSQPGVVTPPAGSQSGTVAYPAGFQPGVPVYPPSGSQPGTVYPPSGSQPGAPVYPPSGSQPGMPSGSQPSKVASLLGEIRLEAPPEASKKPRKARRNTCGVIAVILIVIGILAAVAGVNHFLKNGFSNPLPPGAIDMPDGEELGAQQVDEAIDAWKHGDRAGASVQLMIAIKMAGDKPRFYEDSLNKLVDNESWMLAGMMLFAQDAPKSLRDLVQQRDRIDTVHQVLYMCADDPLSKDLFKANADRPLLFRVALIRYELLYANPNKAREDLMPILDGADLLRLYPEARLLEVEILMKTNPEQARPKLNELLKLSEGPRDIIPDWVREFARELDRKLPK
jgi:serine/threonine-protein kinase